MYLYITLYCTVYNNFMLYYRIILYYYHWYCTVLSLYVLVARPTEKKVRQTLLLPSAANWSLRRPPRLDRPEAVAWCRLLSKCSWRCLCIGWLVRHYARSLLCSGRQSLLRLGSFFVPSSKHFPHLPTLRKHSSLVLWSGSVGGCIRDTVEADRGLGSRAERVRCFGLKFVPNIFCPEISPIEALG